MKIPFVDKIAAWTGYEKMSRARTLETTAYDAETGLRTPEDYETYALTYQQSEWVYACVSIITQTAAQVPFKVYQRDSKGNLEPAEDSDLSKLMRHVNPQMTLFDLKEATMSHLQLAGNAYWELERDFPGGPPTAIYPLRPDRVRIVPDKEKYIKGYIYEVNGQKITFNPDEIIHFKYFNPLNEYYGQGPISAARNSAAIDLFAKQYNKAFFKNAARPDAVLETDGELSPQTFRRLKKQWEQAHRGAKKAHKLAILEQGLKYKQVSLAPKDAEYIGGQKLSREGICAVFKVPPGIVGIHEYSSYANLRQQDQLYWHHCMLPNMAKIEGPFNEFFAPMFSNGRGEFVGKWDTSGVEALQKDQRMLAQIRSLMVQGGIKTINEVRAEMDLERVPWGDTWHAPATLLPVNSAAADNEKGVRLSSAEVKALIGEVIAEKIAERQKTMALPEPEVIEGIRLSDSTELVEVSAEVKARRRRGDRLNRDRLEAPIKKQARGIFKGVSGDVLKVVRKTETLKRLREHAESREPDEKLTGADRAVMQDIFAGYDPLEGRDEEFREMNGVLKGTYEVVARHATRRLVRVAQEDGKSITPEHQKAAKQFELINPEILFFIGERENLIKDATDEEFAAVMDTILREFFGKHRDQADPALIAGIERAMAGADTVAAARIAKTETTVIGNQAGRDVYKKNWVEMFEWVHSGSDMPRESHLAMDGLKINVSKGETFAIHGFPYAVEGPGDGSLPVEEVANCGCDTAPSISEEYEIPEDLWTGS